MRQSLEERRMLNFATMNVICSRHLFVDAFLSNF